VRVSADGTERTGYGGLDNPACESGAGVLCVHYSQLVILHKPKYVIFNNILPIIFTPEKEQGAKSERGVKLYKKSNPVPDQDTRERQREGLEREILEREGLKGFVSA
jgi:hypothetical protein